jgi:anti-sigma factor RsiW
MNCDDVSEFLPWLLNGTLESKERDEVRRHLATCERCRAALEDTREAWTTFDQHLPAEALVALAYGETPSGIDAAVAERHLASCPQCAAELELARMSRRLEEDEKVAVFPPAHPRNEAAERAASRSWRAAALAAGFAALVGGSVGFYEFQQAGDMAAQLARRPAAQESPRAVPAPAPGTVDPALAEKVAQLEKETAAYKARSEQQIQQAAQQVAELDRKTQASRQPQVNAWSGLVNPADVERGANAAPPQEKVVPGDRLSVLSLGTESEGTAVRELEIRDAGGTLVWTSPGLRSDAKSQQFSFGLPAGSLKPGRYTIQLYEKVGGQRVKRESYRIRVE